MPIALSDGVLNWLRTSGARIGLVVALAVVVSRIGTLAVRRLRRRVEGHPGATAELTLQRTTTLAQTTATAVRAGIWTVAVLLVLGQVGIDVAPLVAGAGVVGVALGFGAQSLVKDFLSGFFILLENQFGVGDQVEINALGGTVAGRVDSMTLRATWIRSPEGILHVIPNGNVQLVSNRSRGAGRLEVDVRVSFGGDVEAVRRRLEELLREMAGDPSAIGIIGEPRIERTEAFAGEDTVLTVSAEVRPSRRDDLHRELRRRIARRFLAAPQDVTVMAADGPG
ncbi:MAG TPA: mechanosensitive ion channel domain-containing protein [Actinomycetota bacterium]